MDLRGRLTGNDIERGATVLNYQPFILSDDIQTGVAYSWIMPLGIDARSSSSPLVFRKSESPAAEWDAFVDANARLRAMYDRLLDEVASRYPGGTLFDSACNNGYFPVGAELRGMRGTGIDRGGFQASVTFLNETLGTSAKFFHEAYDLRAHRFPELGTFDVTVASAIMCHLPDPLNFLAGLGRMTRGAILFWGQAVDTERLLVSYQEPYAPWAAAIESEFPHAFNCDTRISIGMFKYAAKQMGFKDVIQVPHEPSWLDQVFTPPGRSLERELEEGSSHFALLMVR